MLTLPDTHEVPLSINPRDAKGNPAKIDGVPSWTSSDDSVLLVVAEADGMSAKATAVGPLGMAQVRVDADANLGSGTTSLTGTLDVEVVAGTAVTLGVSAGAPTEQPTV